MLFNVHKQFLSPDHITRKAADAERKLQNSHYDHEKKGWDWENYVALNKEQHTIITSLADYGHSGIDGGTKVCHFLQGIKNTELEAAVNGVPA